MKTFLNSYSKEFEVCGWKGNSGIFHPQFGDEIAGESVVTKLVTTDGKKYEDSNGRNFAPINRPIFSESSILPASDNWQKWWKVERGMKLLGRNTFKADSVWFTGVSREKRLLHFLGIRIIAYISVFYTPLVLSRLEYFLTFSSFPGLHGFIGFVGLMGCSRSTALQENDY